MKKATMLIATSLLMLTGIVHAAGNGHHHHRPMSGHHHHSAGRWIMPLVIGGAVGYAISQQYRPAPAPVLVYPNTLPPAPYGYHYEQIIDANCNCYRWVLVSN